VEVSGKVGLVADPGVAGNLEGVGPTKARRSNRRRGGSGAEREAAASNKLDVGRGSPAGDSSGGGGEGGGYGGHAGELEILCDWLALLLAEMPIVCDSLHQGYCSSVLGENKTVNLQNQTLQSLSIKHLYDGCMNASFHTKKNVKSLTKLRCI
jgi:hypothetical protein